MDMKGTNRLWLLFTALFLILMPYRSAQAALSAEQYISKGKGELFEFTLTGALAAHQTFTEAENQYGARCDNPGIPFIGDCTVEEAREKGKIHGYLAMTRILDLILRDDGGSVDTVTELLAQYGIERRGTYLDDVSFDFPIRDDEFVDLPETAPKGEFVRAFMGGHFLNALNASILDMDEVLHYVELADRSSNSVEVDTREIIYKDEIDSDAHIEVDSGDYYFFRAWLKAAKAFALIITAYDLDVDVREIVALANMDVLSLKGFFERYPDVWTLLTTGGTPGVDGAGNLTAAKAALSGAIADYLKASELIRNDNDTSPDAEELIEIDSMDEEEALFRENFQKIQTSLDQGGAADLVLERIGTEYHVFAGDDYHDYMNGYHPEYFGYDYLGKASDTQTFEGNRAYPYWIVVTAPGHIAFVDTLESDGAYFNPTRDGNTLDWQNVGGAPDQEVARVGAQFEASGGGFLVIEPQSPLSTLKVWIHVPQDAELEEHLRLDLNPLFDNAPDLRDMLPEFSCDDEPLYGTMGAGLPNGPDPTLGGIMPDMTHEEWDLEHMPSGDVIIPTATMDIQDGSVADWAGINPVFQDQTGEEDFPFQGNDLQDLYLAEDGQYLYVRMTLADGPPNMDSTQDPWQAMNYFVQFRTASFEFEGTRYNGAYYDPYDQAWGVMVNENASDWQFTQHYRQMGEAQAVGNDLEWRVPLNQVGPMSARFLTAWVDWIGQYSDGPEDFNETCLQVGPFAALAGEITVPAHDGDGPVFVGVFDADGEVNMDGDRAVAWEVVYPGQINNGIAAYTFSRLPAGARVVVGAFWDADFNGVRTPGDYIGRSDEMTLTEAGPNTVDLTLGIIQSRGPGEPFFRACSVQAYHRPDGSVLTALTADVVDSDGTVPYTIDTLSVAGPNGFSHVFTQEDFMTGVFWYGADGQPVEGEYTFTAVDENGQAASCPFYLTAGELIPVPESATLQASGDLLAPTLSWGAVPGYEGNLFYRARVYDMADNAVWTSSFTTQTRTDMPQGWLQDGQAYRWRLEVFDAYTYYAANKRAVSDKIALETDDTQPFFNYALVYHRSDQSGLWTVVQASVVDPDGGAAGASPLTVTVNDPQGNPFYTFQAQDFDPAFGEYYVKLQGAPPADGVYEFIVTDPDGNTAVSYDYVAVRAIPRVEVGTLRASGEAGSLTPTLSWAAPAGMDRPLYFRVIVEDEQFNWVWATSRITDTTVQVPEGILEPGQTYLWYVRTLDDSKFVHFSNQGRSERLPLDPADLNGATPFFTWAGVFRLQNPDGVFTALDAGVVDPNGTLPGSLQALDVQGPSGFSQDLLSAGEYSPGDNDFYLTVQGVPEPGVYTFTAQDEEGIWAVTHDHAGTAAEMPLVDAATIAVTGNPLAPTISWQGVSGFKGRVYYRVRVYDDEGDLVYRTAREPYTAQTLPEGVLQAGDLYFVRIEAQDHRYWTAYDTRSNSARAAWDALPGEATSLSGQVTDLEGRPISNVWVQAYSEPCSDAFLGGAMTDDEGFYTLSYLPPGEVYVRTCAGCSHQNFVDEWFDWLDGTPDCNGAAPVLVLPNQQITDIDFQIQQGPKRLQWFEVVVGNGTLGAGFGVEPGYRGRLAGASLIRPDGTAFEYDLTDDFSDNWDTECRFLQYWWHQFGPVQPGDYGTYHLTLRFQDGSRETDEYTIQDVDLTAVDPTTISVTVQDDGRVQMAWDAPTSDLQFYQVRVRDQNGKEYYRGPSVENADQADLPAGDLRCLKWGETYSWLVRAYDTVWPLYSRSETRGVTRVYAPASLAGRISYLDVMEWRGEMSLGFDVRAGSRGAVTSAVVTGPNGFSYTFDLDKDYFDISSETRLGLKGWWTTKDLSTASYGLYALQVTFSDGYSETAQKTLSDLDVTPVDAGAMYTQVHGDGAVTFWWGFPGVSGQVYQVRIRSTDQSVEYYKSPNLQDGNMVTAWPYDLRGLAPGTTYLWMVRAFDPTFNTMEQSQSRTFFYDPFASLLKGDLNGNGELDLADAILAMEAAAGYRPEGIHAGRDVSGDGRIGMAEGIYILQYIGRLRTR